MNIKESLLIFISIFLFLLLIYHYHHYPLIGPDYLHGPIINAQDRVLIIAPHPDDETISCAGVISYCHQEKIPVEVVILTDGGNHPGVASLRCSESQRALKILGLHEDNIKFLDYPDGILKRLLIEDWNPAYNDSSDNPKLSGWNMVTQLQTIIREFNPTIIIYPDSQDTHSDHWAASAMVEYACISNGYSGERYTYLVHGPVDWPYPRNYAPESYLYPPIGVGFDEQWFSFNLESVYLKEYALRSYSTQIRPGSYLFSYLRKNELFATYPDIILKKDNISHELFFSDPLGDNQLKDKSTDIRNVNLELGYNYTKITLKTADRVSSNISYGFHIWGFTTNGIEKKDITVYNGTAYYNELHFPVVVEDNYLIIQIPLSFHSYNIVLFSVEVSSSRESDHTPWRRIVME